jgi:hypothetical protein
MKDPHDPQQGNKQSGMRKHDHPGNKKFVFDQKGGSDSSSTPGSIPSIPTETLGLFDTGKK